MKLGEFFVALGFQLEGEQALDKVDMKLDDLASGAAKALAGVASLTAGMGLMLKQALETANGFRQFALATGLSSQELQRWQSLAEQAGIDAGELAQGVKTLQQATADIAMGRGNVAPWQLLGIAPSRNPFDTLRDIRRAIEGLDPAIARTVVSEMGLGEGMLNILRMSSDQFESLNRNFVRTQGQIDQLNKINSLWAQYAFQIKSVKDQLVAALVPVLQPVLRLMILVNEKMASFTQWLNKSSVGAKIVKGILVVLITAVVTLTAGLTALLAILGAVAATMAFMEIAMGPWLGILTLITIAVAALVLVMDDFITGAQGGKSAIGDLVDAFKPLYDMLADIMDFFEKIDAWFGKHVGLSLGKYSAWKDRQDLKMLENQEREGKLLDKDRPMLEDLRKRIQLDAELDGGWRNTVESSPQMDAIFEQMQQLDRGDVSPGAYPTNLAPLSQENNFNFNGPVTDPKQVVDKTVPALEKSLRTFALQRPATP